MKLQRGFLLGRNLLYSVVTRFASRGPVWLTRLTVCYLSSEVKLCWSLQASRGTIVSGDFGWARAATDSLRNRQRAEARH